MFYSLICMHCYYSQSMHFKSHQSDLPVIMSSISCFKRNKIKLLISIFPVMFNLGTFSICNSSLFPLIQVKYFGHFQVSCCMEPSLERQLTPAGELKQISRDFITFTIQNLRRLLFLYIVTALIAAQTLNALRRIEHNTSGCWIASNHLIRKELQNVVERIVNQKNPCNIQQDFLHLRWNVRSTIKST